MSYLKMRLNEIDPILVLSKCVRSLRRINKIQYEKPIKTKPEKTQVYSFHL